MKRLLRAVPCLLLCLILLAATASADMGPKQSVTITVVNAPEGVYYLDLLHREDWDYSNVDLEDYDPALIEGLRHWEGEGWYPALVHLCRAAGHLPHRGVLRRRGSGHGGTLHPDGVPHRAGVRL